MKYLGIIAAVLFIIWVWPNGNNELSSYEPNEYSTKTGVFSRECNEPENPYSYDSGHYAGFEWGEQGNYCSGNSDSFIEGCEEFERQDELFTLCEDSQ